MGEQFHMTPQKLTREEKQEVSRKRAEDMKNQTLKANSKNREEYDNCMKYNSDLYTLDELKEFTFTGPSVVVAPFKVHTINDNGFYIGTSVNFKDEDTFKDKTENAVPYQTRGLIKSIGIGVDSGDYKINQVVLFNRKALSPDAFFTPDRRFLLTKDIDQYKGVYLRFNPGYIECIEKGTPYKDFIPYEEKFNKWE